MHGTWVSECNDRVLSIGYGEPHPLFHPFLFLARVLSWSSDTFLFRANARHHSFVSLVSPSLPLAHAMTAQGLVQAVGVSNYGPRQLERIFDFLQSRGVPLVAAQVSTNLCCLSGLLPFGHPLPLPPSRLSSSHKQQE